MRRGRLRAGAGAARNAEARSGFPRVLSRKKQSRKRADSSAGIDHGIERDAAPSVLQSSRSGPVKGAPATAGVRGRSSRRSLAGGMLANLNVPESSWMADVLYPLEGAESLAAIASSSVIFWVFLTLVPEYCLTLMGNADTMGVPTLGKFIALVSILPVVFLLPFAFFYWLQYLGRVLVASAMGETIPPRLPDRNFDGFLNGMGPWLIWSVLGLVPGLLPLILYGLTLSTASEASSLVALALLSLGLPYIVMALMMTFLHDHSMAATPRGVMGAILQLGGHYGKLCLIVGAALALGAGTFLIALLPAHPSLLALSGGLSRLLGPG